MSPEQARNWQQTEMTTYVQCGVGMTGHQTHLDSQCVLGKDHVLNDSDHVDEHGCHAPVLVSQATIEEVRRVSAALREVEEQEVFDRAHQWAGAMQSFDIAPNGDVALVVSVPSEGIQEVVLLKASELAGLAAASRSKQEV